MIGLWNSRSIKNKIPYFQSIVYAKCYDLFCLTETWLSPEIYDKEILPEHYTIYRHDRNLHGGGVLLAISNNINSRKLKTAYDDIEVVAAEVTLPQNEAILIIGCYLPPNSSTPTVAFLIQSISELITCYPSNYCIILGDVNHPEIEWDSLTSTSESGILITDCFFKFNMHQIIKDPTHEKGNILDIIATNNPQAISNVHIESTCRSDHYLISFHHISKSPPITSKSKETRKLWLYSKTNTPSLQRYITNRLRTTFSPNPTTNVLWNLISSVLNEARIKFIPSTSVQVHTPIWFSPEIRHKLKCVHTSRRSLRRCPNSSTKQAKLMREETELKLLMESTKIKFEQNLITSAYVNPNKLFSYIRNLSTNKSIPTSVYPQSSNTPTSTDLETAQAFNLFFQSVYCKSDYVLPPIDQLPTPSQQIHTVIISREDVQQALHTLDTQKSLGFDDIGPHLLKVCSASESLHTALTELYSACINTATIPDPWKVHKIIPIHKKGDRCIVSNYRPISLLCTTSIILERIIYNQIIAFARSHITTCQFGFLSRRSCLLNLLMSYSKVSTSIDQHHTTDVVYLDYSKAFDTIPHSELLYKLWRFGITGPLWMWFKHYLQNRKQFVQINDAKSAYRSVTSGVPQGSVLGPLLFLIYINDLPQVIHTSDMYLFADDTKLILDVTENHPDTFQADLDETLLWCQTWKLKLNTEKCTTMTFTNNRTNQNIYNINHQQVTASNTARDLGITISNTLTFDEHYKTICTKAFQSFSLIRRFMHLQHASMETKRQLYLCLVRSKLTYCSQLWHPKLVKHCMMLENVQRKCTKFITNDYTSNYRSRLLQTNLLPLMYFYDLQDILYLVKCIQNPPENINLLDYITFGKTPTRFGSKNKLQVKHTYTSNARHFYFHRVVRLWNALPYINLHLPFDKIRQHIIKEMHWKFKETFDPNISCTFHYVCPCPHCHVV